MLNAHVQHIENLITLRQQINALTLSVFTHIQVVHILNEIQVNLCVND